MVGIEYWGIGYRNTLCGYETKCTAKLESLVCVSVVPKVCNKGVNFHFFTLLHCIGKIAIFYPKV